MFSGIPRTSGLLANVNSQCMLMDPLPWTTSRLHLHRADNGSAHRKQPTGRKEILDHSDLRIRIAGHIPKLDSLRGAAILLVLIYHAYGGSIDYRKWRGAPRYFIYLSRYGYTGVELFFVLSGFLITSILLSSKYKTDYYAKFYKRRALRILPAYFAILVVVKIWVGVSWRYILACLLYLANMAGLLGARTSEYAPLWSLAVEEQFYLLWPFCVRRLSSRSLLRLAIGICLVMPILRLLAASISTSIDIRYKTYFIADYLAYGAFIALAIDIGMIHTGNIRSIAGWLMIAGSSLSAVVIYLEYRPSHWPIATVPLNALGTLPFIWVYCSLVLRAIYTYESGNQISNKLLAFLGYISYGLYLIHEFIFYEYGNLAAGTRLGELNASFAVVSARFTIVCGTSILLAYLSRRFYEGYFLRMGRRSEEALR